MPLRRPFAGDNDAGRAIGDLATVLLAHPAFNHRVQVIITAESAFGELPLTDEDDDGRVDCANFDGAWLYVEGAACAEREPLSPKKAEKAAIRRASSCR